MSVGWKIRDDDVLTFDSTIPEIMLLKKYYYYYLKQSSK